MTPSELLLEGVELMLFGLGTVFLFLILLVLMIRVMSWVIERFTAKTSVPVSNASIAFAAKSAPDKPSAVVLAAIQSAIHQHRARRG
jgi:oxaloacetate decarboxylase gamma subunit